MIEFNLPTVSEAETRLDNIFDQAFKADHPAMQDWVAVKFALKKLAAIGEYLWPNQTGLPNEHRDPLLAIEARETSLRRQVFMPGTWVCDKCHFEQNNRTMNAHTGAIGAPLIEEVQVCPNDGETMRKVAWRECSESNYEASLRFLNERDAIEERYAKLVSGGNIFSHEMPTGPGWYWCYNADGDRMALFVVRVDNFAPPGMPMQLVGSWMHAPGKAQSLPREDWSEEAVWLLIPTPNPRAE